MFKHTTAGALFLTLCLSASTEIAEAQSYNLSFKAGGSSWDDIKAMHVGNDNNILATGMFTMTADFGTVSLTSWDYQDGFVAKYDDQGNVIWANAIHGATEQEWGYGITSDANNNVFVVGYFQSPSIYFTANDSLLKGASSNRDVFVAKYNSNGVFQWARSGSGSFSTGRAVTCDSQGNVILAGDYNQSITFSGTTLPVSAGTNIFFVKYDAAGNLVWAKEGASGSMCWIGDMTTDASDNIFVTGKLSGDVTFGSQVVNSNNGGDDMFVAKFNSSGILQWWDVQGKSVFASTTSNNFDCGNGIALDASGSVYVGGSLIDTSYYDVSAGTLVTRQFAMVARYDSGGNLEWLKKYGNNENDVINDITLDANGNIFVIGNYSGVFSVGTSSLPTQTQTRSFMAILNKTNGNTIWAGEHGTYSYMSSNGMGIQISPTTGKVYTCGNFSNSITFGSNTLTAGGTWDMYFTSMNNTVSVLENDSNGALSVYPNPTTGTLQIVLPDYSSGAELFVYSLAGQQVMYSPLQPYQTSVETLGLTPGNYVFVVRTDDGMYRQLVTKQ